MTNFLLHLLIGLLIYGLTCFFIYVALFSYNGGLLKDLSHKKQNNISLYVFVGWAIFCVIFSFLTIEL